MSSVSRVLQNPRLLLRAPRLAFASVIGDPSSVETPHPRLWILMRAIGRFTRLRDLGLKVSKPLGAVAVQPAAQSVFPVGTVERTLAALDADGYAPGIDLPQETLDAILAWAREHPFAADKKSDRLTTLAEVEDGSAPAGMTLGEYRAIDTCPEVQTLLADPALLEIAERYLKVPPRHIGTRMWWSFPTQLSDAQKARNAQLFHYDLDDFRFLKFFWYLTDVDETAGPHVMVLGTHDRKKLAHQLVIRRIPDAEVLAGYGADRVLEIKLPAGKGFAEDTFCLHKGQAPTGKARLLLQLEFGVNDFHHAGH